MFLKIAKLVEISKPWELVTNQFPQRNLSPAVFGVVDDDLIVFVLFVHEIIF
ncbi:MAG: hypothetical protein KAI67_00060 [Candidatus Pacebacteria bacterium]|nr:hypothetical protein [Candidatus Paceibacterota bacterium]